MSKLPLQPLDLARETLRQLAQRRTPPTPDNFRALYHEIAGTEAQAPFPTQELQRIALSLPRDTKERSRLAAQLDTAIEDNNWDAVQQALQACVGAIEVSRSWAGLLRELMAQIDTPHKQLTRARKLAALDHVLSANANNADLLFSRLRGLMQGWQREPLGEQHAETQEASPPPVATRPGEIGDRPRFLRENVVCPQFPVFFGKTWSVPNFSTRTVRCSCSQATQLIGKVCTGC